MTTPAPIRAVIAVRVSTDDQVEGTSLGDQERKCRAEAERLGWEVVAVLRDEGKSGGDWDREGLQDALDMFRRGDANALLVADQDRLARSEYVRVSAEHEMQRLDVLYRPLNLPAGVDPFDESHGEFMAATIGAAAQLVRRKNQWNAANGQRAKARQGRWPGGAAPFGWRLEGKGRDAYPVPDSDEREVIRVAVEALLEHGKTTGEAAALLNSLGYVGRQGSPWTHQRVRRMLESESLTGVVWWGKPTRKYGHNTKMKRGAPKYGEPIKIQLADPPLGEEEWLALHRVLKGRGYGTKADAKPYPNSGSATVCGGKVGGVYRADRDLRQYRCNRNKWVAGNPPLCDCARVNADWLDGQVWNAVIQVLSDPDRLLSLAADYIGLREQASQPEAETVDQVRARIAKLENDRIGKVREWVAAGVPGDVVAAMVGELDNQISAARTYLAQLEAFRANAAAEGERASALMDLARAAAERLPNMTLEEQAEVLRLLRVKVTLLDGTATPRLDIEGVVPGGTDIFDAWLPADGGTEVVDLLAALNTGHEGGCGTLHANSAAAVPARIEALALAAGLGREAAHSQLASAFDVILHLGRDGGTRRLLEIAVPQRLPSGLVEMETAASWHGGQMREGAAAEALTERVA